MLVFAAILACVRTLVVGATGFTGLEVVRLLRERGRDVRALVRPSALEGRRSLLTSLGAEIVAADLKESASLRDACAGVDTIVSTASGIKGRIPGDSIETVDGEGQLSLVDEAERAGVRHFVFISFPNLEPDSALQRAKREVEVRLRRGIPVVTVLKPGHLMEEWLSPALGWDPMHGAVRIYGSGEQPISWISTRDVARFAAAAVHGSPVTGQKDLEMGGPETLTPSQAVTIFRELGAPSFKVDHVEESALDAQFNAAQSSLEKTF
ncbi:MAG TPA: SDR family oxidoreductase, partial [Polyangiaceae bacterium]|nr:SDR family oxidoreductase [Polyangiaceae bacterium]